MNGVIVPPFMQPARRPPCLFATWDNHDDQGTIIFNTLGCNDILKRDLELTLGCMANTPDAVTSIRLLQMHLNCKGSSGLTLNHDKLTSLLLARERV